VDKVDCWESKLFDYVEECHSKKFRYGSHDCVKFSMKGVEAMTGRNLLKDHGFGWKNRSEAQEWLQKKSIIEWFDEHLEERPIKLLQRGDLVCKQTDDGLAMGLWLSPKAVFLNTDGLHLVDRTHILKAWSY